VLPPLVDRQPLHQQRGALADGLAPVRLQLLQKILVAENRVRRGGGFERPVE